MKIIGRPELMRALVSTGMRSRTLMEWVLRIMANLLRPDELGPAEAAYRAVAALARVVPEAACSRGLRRAPDLGVGEAQRRKQHLVRPGCDRHAPVEQAVDEPGVVARRGGRLGALVVVHRFRSEEDAQQRTDHRDLDVDPAAVEGGGQAAPKRAACSASAR